MRIFWLVRADRRRAEDRLKPGSCYRRQLGRGLAATATVLGVDPDPVGVPHVRFTMSVSLSPTEQWDRGTRVLALQTFLDTYRERLP